MIETTLSDRMYSRMKSADASAFFNSFQRKLLFALDKNIAVVMRQDWSQVSISLHQFFYTMDAEL